MSLSGGVASWPMRGTQRVVTDLALFFSRYHADIKSVHVNVSEEM